MSSDNWIATPDTAHVWQDGNELTERIAEREANIEAMSKHADWLRAELRRSQKIAGARLQLRDHVRKLKAENTRLAALASLPPTEKEI